MKEQQKREQEEQKPKASPKNRIANKRSSLDISERLYKDKFEKEKRNSELIKKYAKE